MAARLVSTWNQIADNLSRLEAVAKLPRQDPRRIEYDSLIRRGSCFLAYSTRSGIAFAPSRFIGYVDNDVMKHAMHKASADGRKTNVRLDELIGERRISSFTFEREFLAFCVRLGIQPNKTGSGGSERKFWISRLPDELVDQTELRAIEADPDLRATTKVELKKSRIGQGIFRSRLIEHWKCCCLTGCDVESILKASHIKPWWVSDNRERLDPFNGLLLSPNADALFDRGLISFKGDGTLLVSNRIKRGALGALLGDHKKRIVIERRHGMYLSYHREHCFNKKYV